MNAARSARRLISPRSCDTRQHGDVPLPKILEFLHASAGEDRIAHGQRLIHNQHFGIDVNGGGKSQAHIHAGGIFLDRPIDELADFRESFDARKSFV